MPPASGSARGIREGTVEVHVRAVIRELNVQNRTQAALKATNAGLPG
jgi:DNA-binding NarL/FixJ family response regulator